MRIHLAKGLFMLPMQCSSSSSNRSKGQFINICNTAGNSSSSSSRKHSRQFIRSFEKTTVKKSLFTAACTALSVRLGKILFSVAVVNWRCIDRKCVALANT